MSTEPSSCESAALHSLMRGLSQTDSAEEKASPAAPSVVSAENPLLPSVVPAKPLQPKPRPPVTGLPPYLALAQKDLNFLVTGHPVYGDENGQSILEDMGAYAREIYALPQEKDPKSFTRLRTIPRISMGDSALFEAALTHQVPVILTNSPLVSKSCCRWTPEYLASKFGDEREMTVYRSLSRYFRYWSKDHHTGDYPFEEPTNAIKMTFKQFLERSGPSVKPACEPTEWLYLQESLSNHPELSDEFRAWDWTWLLDVVKRFGWGMPDTNSLFVGMDGNVTPIHFDDQENIFCQIQGQKEVLLYPPTDFRAFYPFPVDHACDRQSMVNVDDPDLERFPNHRYARPHWAMLQPGETMYLPGQWWHHFRNRKQHAMSITFWSKQKPFDMSKFAVPLQEKQLFCVRRNVEDFVKNTVGSKNMDRVMAGVAAMLQRNAAAGGTGGEVKVGDDLVAASIDNLVNRAYDKMRMLLQQVMLPAQVDNFILEMVEGRYGTNDTEKWTVPITRDFL